MQITKPTKAEVTRELKDYIFITLGLISYALGRAAFSFLSDMTGVLRISAIIYYAWILSSGRININAVPMTSTRKFSIKTTFAIFGLTFFLWFSSCW